MTWYQLQFFGHPSPPMSTYRSILCSAFRGESPAVTQAAIFCCRSARRCPGARFIGISIVDFWRQQQQWH